MKIDPLDELEDRHMVYLWVVPSTTRDDDEICQKEEK